MKIYIYDIEVFEQDWVVVFREATDIYKNHIVIHNNNYQLKEFITQSELLLCGFNNKGYDDWIIMTMMLGGDNAKVKEHNDYIIKGGHQKEPWTFPFIQYKKRPFKSMDLRDDLAEGLSLKAIEGNSKANIRESKIDFKITHKLNQEELEEVILYCCTDVDNTLELYKSRDSYIKSKYTLAKIKGVDPIQYLPLTNAKMTAEFMDAVATKYDDEFEYDVPACVNVGKYKEVLKFFANPVEYSINKIQEKINKETLPRKIKSLNNQIKKIREKGQYKTSFKMDVAGVPHKYGWGGLHGARKNVQLYEQDDYIMVDIDVGSYYPSLCLLFAYASRSIKDPTLYRAIYEMRLAAKHKGDKDTADALKLVLNTFYGAMKNKYNKLYDPRMATSICATGMLLLTTLICSLEDVPSFELIQSNTDGIFIRFHKDFTHQIEDKVLEWEKATNGLKMEYTIVHTYIAKDVNNYIIEQGETYLVDENHNRTITKEDKHKIETKGGYVSLYHKGDFKNNSMRVVHKAIVDYFMFDTPIEKTINEETDIANFQIITKTGSSYDGAFHLVDGEKVDVQKVNRIYASKDSKYGSIYKVKNGKVSKIEYDNEDDEDIEDDETERIDKVASLPDHCIIDNEFKLSLDDVDKSFYIALAHKRVKDYLGINEKATKNKITKEKEKMATTKNESNVTPNTLNVYQKLIKARLMFQQAEPKKTGKNTFAEFMYFELADIVPCATAIFNELGLVFITTFTNESAKGVLVNCDKSDEQIVFESPVRQLSVISNTGKNKMNELQGLGAEETYQRRYLYLMALDIVEADVFDLNLGNTSVEGKAKAPKEVTEKAEKEKVEKSKKPIDPIKRDEIKKDLIDKDGEASELQIKSIKQGLKKLRANEETDYEPYINTCIRKIKDGLTKTQAENLLIEIGDKLEE